MKRIKPLALSLLAFFSGAPASAVAQPAAQGFMLCKCSCQTPLMGGNAVSVKFLAPSGNGLSCSAQNKIACEGFSGVGSTLMGCEAYLSPTPADAKLKAAENLLGKTRASGK